MVYLLLLALGGWLLLRLVSAPNWEARRMMDDGWQNCPLCGASGPLYYFRVVRTAGGRSVLACEQCAALPTHLHDPAEPEVASVLDSILEAD